MPSRTSTSSNALLDLAEDAYAYLGGRPWQQTHESERFVLRHVDTRHPLGGIACRVRLGDGFDAGVAEIRRGFAGAAASASSGRSARRRRRQTRTSGS